MGPKERSKTLGITRRKFRVELANPLFENAHRQMPLFY